MPLPKISKETCKSLIDFLEDQKRINEIMGNFLASSAEDTQDLRDALMEFSKKTFVDNDEIRTVFLAGAVFIYEAFKRQIESDELKKGYK